MQGSEKYYQPVEEESYLEDNRKNSLVLWRLTVAALSVLMFAYLLLVPKNTQQMIRIPVDMQLIEMPGGFEDCFDNGGSVLECCSSTDSPVLGGVDVVSTRMLEDGGIIYGSNMFSYILTTSTGPYSFWFASAAARDVFASGPWRYAPAFGGFDAATFCEDISLGANPLDASGPFWKLMGENSFWIFSSVQDLDEMSLYDPKDCLEAWKESFGEDDGLFNTQCFMSSKKEAATHLRMRETEGEVEVPLNRDQNKNTDKGSDNSASQGITEEIYKALVQSVTTGADVSDLIGRIPTEEEIEMMNKIRQESNQNIGGEGATPSQNTVVQPQQSEPEVTATSQVESESEVSNTPNSSPREQTTAMQVDKSIIHSKNMIDEQHIGESTPQNVAEILENAIAKSASNEIEPGVYQPHSHKNKEEGTAEVASKITAGAQTVVGAVDESMSSPHQPVPLPEVIVTPELVPIPDQIDSRVTVILGDEAVANSHHPAPLPDDLVTAGQVEASHSPIPYPADSGHSVVSGDEAVPTSHEPSPIPDDLLTPAQPEPPHSLIPYPSEGYSVVSGDELVPISHEPAPLPEDLVTSGQLEPPHSQIPYPAGSGEKSEESSSSSKDSLPRGEDVEEFKRDSPNDGSKRREAVIHEDKETPVELPDSSKPKPSIFQNAWSAIKKVFGIGK